MTHERRAYRSAVRDASARATREAVLAAAEHLFLSSGFTGTSMDQIAHRAGVSRPTVFALGTKADLLAQVWDRSSAVDDGASTRPSSVSMAAVLAERHPREVLALYADRVTHIASRLARLERLLEQAAATSPDLRELWRTRELRRFEEVSALIDRLSTLAALRHDQAMCCDVVWVATSGQVYDRLVHERGWSQDRYRDWLRITACEQVLTAAAPPPAGQPRRRFRLGAS